MQGAKLDFANWLDTAFPPNPRRKGLVPSNILPSKLLLRYFNIEDFQVQSSSKFPCNVWPIRQRYSYCNELTQGPHVVRPWNLAWRADFGLSSILEPDELYTLAEMYLVEGQLVFPTAPQRRTDMCNSSMFLRTAQTSTACVCVWRSSK